jgi:beta-N-acetylhexosaminidase
LSADPDRLAARCLFPSFPGLTPPAWVLDWLERGLGGIVLFAYNVLGPEQVESLTSELRAARPDLLVAADEEGGDVTRLEASRGSSYPGNLALGAVDDVALTAGVASAIAGDLVRAGVNMNLAPVADANTNPQNPVIGVRSFGSDVDLVARHTAAFVEGTQRQGVVACAKHFPGHGDTAADSHLELPTVSGDLDAALVPFRAAIEAGVRSVMIGHLRVPGLSDGPATLSRAVATDLLRGDLGFDGLVISDALEMRAVSATVGIAEGAVQALAAGVDALCLGHDVGKDMVERTHGAIVEAVDAGRLPLARLAEAAERVERCSRWAAAASAEGSAPAAIGAEAARRAAHASGDVAIAGPALVVELVPEANIAAGEAALGLGDLVPDAPVVRLEAPLADVRPLLEGHDARRLVLVLRDAGRHAWERPVAEELLALRPDAVVVETGLPGWLPEGTTAAIETHGAARVNLEAALDLLAAR